MPRRRQNPPTTISGSPKRTRRASTAHSDSDGGTEEDLRPYYQRRDSDVDSTPDILDSDNLSPVVKIHILYIKNKPLLEVPVFVTQALTFLATEFMQETAEAVDQAAKTKVLRYESLCATQILMAAYERIRHTSRESGLTEVSNSLKTKIIDIMDRPEYRFVNQAVCNGILQMLANLDPSPRTRPGARRR